jgi:hypothetical protein
MVRCLALMAGTGFNLMGGLWNMGGGGERHQRRGGTWVAVGFSFERKLTWGCVREVHPSLYRGVGGVRKD